MTKDKLLIDFRSSSDAKQWEVVNDMVMGGLSKSKLAVTSDNTLLFQGEVSLENYGGFASVRTYPQDFLLEGYTGIILRVKGDGKRYRLRLRTDDEHDGIAYQSSFITDPGKWIIVQLPFREFVPVYRGRVVSHAPNLKPGLIRRVGFMIADGQAGFFRLEVAWVKAYSENGKEEQV